jgi:hypothetical protein
MAIFGSKRDISLFRHINRELLWDIITQQCAIYKLKLDETVVNIYGEAAHEKFYTEPVLFNALIERGDQLNPTDDMGVSYSREMTFKFFRDDMVDAQFVPEVGDIVLYQESFFEIDNVNDNQLFAGKDPEYPYSNNPLNPGLENFGSNISIICKAHHVPADRVAIKKSRI